MSSSIKAWLDVSGSCRTNVGANIGASVVAQAADNSHAKGSTRTAYDEGPAVRLRRRVLVAARGRRAAVLTSAGRLGSLACGSTASTRQGLDRSVIS